jgi:hypothetical protein
MRFTIVDNACRVQKFPFPIVIFRKLKLGGNRPLLVMKVSRILSWDATIFHRFCHVKIWVLALTISWKSLTFQHYTMCKTKTDLPSEIFNYFAMWSDLVHLKERSERCNLT